jgi:hypothetical protein
MIGLDSNRRRDAAQRVCQFLSNYCQQWFTIGAVMAIASEPMRVGT